MVLPREELEIDLPEDEMAVLFQKQEVIYDCIAMDARNLEATDGEDSHVSQLLYILSEVVDAEISDD